MSGIKLGMIGLGRFSRLHLQCIKQIPGLALTAVADIDAARAAQVAAEWNCKDYADWRRMLAETKLDAVIVLTPETHHMEPVVAALEAGCDVFVEKPLAVDSASARHMVEAAERAGKLLTVGHVCRFDARYTEIRRAIEDGKLGKLRSLYARRNNPQSFFPIYRRANPIFILGIHDIDLLRWFAASPVKEVYAKSSGRSAAEHDLVWSMLTFGDGTIGVIENHWLLPDGSPAQQDVRMEITGDAGIIHFQDPDQTLVLWDDRGTAAPFSPHWSEVHGRYSGALFEELLHFFACVRSGTPSDVLRPEDAYAAVRVAEAIVESCATGRPVQV